MTRLTNAAPLLVRLLLGICERDLDRVVDDEVHEFVKALPLISTAMAAFMGSYPHPQLSLNAHAQVLVEPY